MVEDLPIAEVLASGDFPLCERSVSLHFIMKLVAAGHLAF
jgi:hypothetical protein